MNKEMGENSTEFDLRLVVTMGDGWNWIRILSCGRVWC
jgi:hypothetical protein